MNTLAGTIETIKSNGSLSIVQVRVGKEMLKTVLVDPNSDQTQIHEGQKIKMIFKETEVVIGKGPCLNISLQNKLAGKIIHIEKGDLLCKLTINTSVGTIKSIITAAAVSQLELAPGVEITAMIKTNETLLSH